MSSTRPPRVLIPRRRTAFTLVELLVVIAIIGILVGLLLPAVQAARGAARRVSCMNNLTQLGLGMHHHEFSLESLPAGVINPDGPIVNEATGQDVSWIVQILPYIEQRNIYEKFDMEAGAYADSNQPACSQRIPTLVCPSYPGGALQSEYGTTIGISTYAGCYNSQEAPINVDNNGVLFLNSRIRYSEILDGSTQTILLGELIPENKDLSWASGTRATLRNTSGITAGSNWNPNAADDLDPLEVGGFGSFHPGGAVFTFADGSTTFLSQNIDPELFRKLGNRADGELLNDERY